MREDNFWGAPWAILPEALLRIESACASHEAPVLPHALQNKKPTEGQIAVLPIQGLIVPYTSAFTRWAGATCLDALTIDFCEARDNPAISAIVLSIDSPGGVVTGVHAFSQLVFAARAFKPIIAQVSGLAASAAYWIAAAASQIVVDPTASLGSIGVVMRYTDTSEHEKREGRITTHIISSQSPYKRLDATTEQGQAQLQAQVDQLAEVFVEAVALYRNVTVATVLSDFGQGSLLVGRHAVAQGLADSLASLSVLPTLFFPSTTGVFSMTASPNATHHLTPPPLVAESPLPPSLPRQEAVISLEASYTQGFEAGLREGRIKEWQRIESIEAQSIPGYEPLIAALKADGVSTGLDAAVQIEIAQKLQCAQLDAALRQDAPPPLPPMEETPALAGLPLEARCAAEWERSAALREEFHSLGGYTAYRKAEARGLCQQFQSTERRKQHA